MNPPPTKKSRKSSSNTPSSTDDQIDRKFMDEIDDEEELIIEEFKKISTKDESGQDDSSSSDSESQEDNNMEDDNQPEGPYLPHHKSNSNQELDFDNSTYKSLHRFLTPWPIPSFDFIQNSQSKTNSPPYQFHCVTGTQVTDEEGQIPKHTDISPKRPYKVYVWNLFKLHDTLNDEDDDEEDHQERNPGYEIEQVCLNKKKYSDQNRVRCMPQNNSIVATYLDNGHLAVLDLTSSINALDRSKIVSKDPQFKILYRSDFISPGWGLSWSPLEEGIIATGGADAKLQIHRLNTGSILHTLQGHSRSIEDIQWSPSESNVLASCSCDGTVRIWDTRSKKCQLMWKASKTDVNVISWNKIEQRLLASGSDDGSIDIWDLRMVFQNLSQNPKAPITAEQHFNFHQGAITSIEWHPSDESMLVASSEDDSCSIWDLSLESSGNQSISGVPDQLLFLHMGISEVKEVHWHPQIENMLVCCGGNSLHVFQPSNLFEK